MPRYQGRLGDKVGIASPAPRSTLSTSLAGVNGFVAGEIHTDFSPGQSYSFSVDPGLSEPPKHPSTALVLTMVLGIRVSYHDAQKASASMAPVCPCATCFSGGEHAMLKAACETPAREARIPSHKSHTSTTTSLARLMGSHIHKTRIGFRLGRRPSVDTLASDMRPLRNTDS